MGLKHEAKKGTVIEANGVKIVVLRGSPLLEITAPPNVGIKMSSATTLATLQCKPRPRQRR